MESDSEPLTHYEDPWMPVNCGIAGSAESAVSDARLDLWTLVLEARYVPCRVESGTSGTQLFVPREHYRQALRELKLFEEKNRDWPPLPPPVRVQEQTVLATLSILLLLATFHNITHLKIPFSGQEAIDWTALGSARAGDIIHGEWWRAVTSLTLHSGVVHLCSNLLIGGCIMMLLSREVGSGFAWSTALCAGVLGNLINAGVQLPTHVSVGASTGVFGAVGVLTALSIIRYKEMPRRRMLALGAGMALLAALGTEGEHTDLGAHFFGFASGVGFGIVVGVAADRIGRWKAFWNKLSAMASAALVTGAWWLAVRHGL